MIILQFIRTMSRKLNNPSAERNKQFILEILQKYIDLDATSKILEIGSGTGQHIAHFAKHLPNATFQPSEVDTSLFGSIEAYSKGLDNVAKPLKIDVSTDSAEWNAGKDYDDLININMIHITNPECTEGLFKNAGALLKVGGQLITYGPYARDGAIEPQSNVDFDQYLKRQNAKWGLRDINDLRAIARAHGLNLLHIHDMPANNKCLIWRKE